MNPTYPNKHRLHRAALALILAGFSAGASLAQSTAENDAAAPKPDEVKTAAATDAKSDAKADKTVRLDAFEVKSERDYGYRATNSGSVTGSGTPIKDTPFSVNVITSEFIEDKGSEDLRDIVRYVSDMSSTNKDEHEIYGRGFLSNIKVDGGLENRGAFSLDTADRIEITKGPASILQGEASAGGVVNVITKRPKFRPDQDVAVSAGSWDAKKFSISSTGPIIDKRLAYLAQYTRSTSEGWVDYTFKRESTYLGALTWRPLDTLEFTVSAQDTHRRYGNAQHLTTSHPAFYAADLEAYQLYDSKGLARPSKYPKINETVRAWLNRTAGFGADEPAEQIIITSELYPHGLQANMQGPQQYRDLDSQRQNAEGRWHVNDWLDVRATYYNSRTYKENADYSTFRQVGGLRLNDRATQVFERQKRSFYEVDIAMRFNVLGTQHRLLLGHQFRDNSGESTNRRTGTISFNPATDADLNLMDLINAANPGPIDYPNIDASYARSRATYLVDVIGALEDHLHVMVGARHTQRLQGTIHEWKITPQYGAVYSIPNFEALSVYASYSESFTPNLARDGLGNLIPPKIEQNKEVGAKIDFLDGKVTGTMSLFNLQQNNVNLRDFAAEAELGIKPLYIFAGKAESEGAEADIVFTPMRNYQVVLAWSRLWEAETVTADDVRQEGVRLDGAPEYMFSIWNKYTFVSGALKGFYVGAGAKLTGPIHIHPSWSVTINSEPYWFADLLLGYHWRVAKNVDADVSARINNLLDEQYLDGTFRPSLPLNGTVNLKFSF